jgi:hypothetical protein
MLWSASITWSETHRLQRKQERQRSTKTQADRKERKVRAKERLPLPHLGQSTLNEIFA